MTSRLLDTAQVCYNPLDPSAGAEVPSGFPSQDFGDLLDHTRQQQMGVMAIRVLTAGALSGAIQRQPVAVPSPTPIASGPDDATDVQHAQSFRSLVDTGQVESLVEAALRYCRVIPVSNIWNALQPISNPALCRRPPSTP